VGLGRVEFVFFDFSTDAGRMLVRSVSLRSLRPSYRRPSIIRRKWHLATAYTQSFFLFIWNFLLVTGLDAADCEQLRDAHRAVSSRRRGKFFLKKENYQKPVVLVYTTNQVKRATAD